MLEKFVNDHCYIVVQMDENRMMKKDEMTKTIKDLMKDDMEKANKLIKDLDECIDTSK